MSEIEEEEEGGGSKETAKMVHEDKVCRLLASRDRGVRQQPRRRVRKSDYIYTL